MPTIPREVPGGGRGGAKGMVREAAAPWIRTLCSWEEHHVGRSEA